jgi:hypothetical protein
MLRNLLCAGALALACVSPAKAEQAYTHPHVRQVVCYFGNMMGRGTAWRISKGRFVSVSHVTGRGGSCYIDGKPITVEHDDPFGDFSIVRTDDRTEGGIPLNCNGYYHGYHYYSVGYARGQHPSVAITLRANKLFFNFFAQWQIFTGIETVIPGMSGGPILNASGEAVGAVNAYNKQGVSWSRSYKETVLCQGSDPQSPGASSAQAG